VSAKLEFDDAMAKDVLATTLLTLLTPERKETLLREAIITVLVEKDKSSYGSGAETRLQHIFKQVVYDHAKAEIERLLADDPDLKQQLDVITKETVLAAFATVRDHMKETVTRILEQAMKRGY